MPMALTIPPKPKQFAANLPPPGYRVSYVSFAATRKIITPRLQLIHTNGAANQGSIESSKAWAERRTYNGSTTTLPTFQVDMDGDAAMFINLNQAQNACYKVNGWAISYETADSGYKQDPTISEFTGAQLQALANGCAYCSVLFKIPLYYPKAWDGSGTASHTEPYGYPYWTNSNGKICPGQKKKAQVRDVIIPHARKIVAAWTGTTPPPTPPPSGDTVNWNPTAQTVAGVVDAPPVIETVQNKWNDWALIALLKTVQRKSGLPVTGKYDQATATAVDDSLAGK
jgi:hypothetical protein